MKRALNEVNGMFKVGNELKACEYLLKPISKDANMSVYSSSNPNDLIDFNTLLGQRYVTLEIGQYLEIVDCEIYEVE